MAKLNCVDILNNINKNMPEYVPSPPLSAIENILITEQDVSYWFLDIRIFKKNPGQDNVTLIITVCLQITSQSCDRFLSSRRPSCVIIYLANPFQIWCKASLAKGKLSGLLHSSGRWVGSKHCQNLTIFSNILFSTSAQVKVTLNAWLFRPGKSLWYWYSYWIYVKHIVRFKKQY